MTWMQENNNSGRTKFSAEALSALRAALRSANNIRFSQVTNWNSPLFALMDKSDDPAAATFILTPNTIYVNVVNVARMASLAGSSYDHFLPGVFVHEMTHLGLNLQRLWGLALPNRGINYWLLNSENLANEMQSAYNTYLDDKKVTPCSPFGK
jgi:hypothetical protein